jgi:molybdate transport system ATP-binding protein
MRKITVRHGPLTVVENLDWVIRRGENWALVGPNGSGKTTLVKMISGDHLQAYANEIYLFGRRRGSGESIWEIKEKIGLVSFELQVGYRAEIAALSVVVSGFYSSIGLYRIAEREQRRAALGWMALLGIEDLAPKPFAHLSQGQQRMVLLARAMVKRPLLLLLDEPCQGLDPSNRRMVFEVIEAIGRQAGTQILLVTHFESEMPDCIRHVLRLGGGLQTDQSVRKAR